MRIIHYMILLLFLGDCSPGSRVEYDLAIKNIHLIDGTGDSMRTHTNVFIRDGRIVGICDEWDNAGAKAIIDGSDRYLIPGLFDPHVHLLYDSSKIERSLRHLVHFGVTSILVPGGHLGTYENLKRFDSLEQNGHITAPHLYYTSLIVTKPGTHPMKTYGSSHYKDGVNVHLIKNQEQIGSIANRAQREGAIALKLMVEDGPQPPFVERINEEYIQTMSREGVRTGLPLFTHVSDMKEVKMSVDNGAKSLMHFLGVRINRERDAELIRQITRDSVSWVTTMMLGKSFFYPLNKEWMEQEGWQVYGQDELLPLYDTNGILAEQSRMILEHFAGSSTITMEQLLKPMMEDIAWLYDQGVNVVTGTDVGGRPYILPGISLHEEMQLLQMGGMDPLDIIRTTTRNAAQMLGVLEDYGTVETGKYADLVILARNPLEDITHTRSITRVIKHGKIQQRIQPGSGD